jgi:membrane-bound metal-dependent hydrolase YbcI (DUF457 family)
MQRNFSPAAYTATITHYAAHALAGLALVSLVAPLDITTALIAIAAAIIPDIDTDLGLPHRAASHSLIALALVGAGGYRLGIAAAALVPFVVGYASHLLVDLMHGNGIMLAYPLRTFVHVAILPVSNITTAAAFVLAIGLYYPRQTVANIALLPQPTITATAAPTVTPTPLPPVGQRVLYQCPDGWDIAEQGVKGCTPYYNNNDDVVRLSSLGSTSPDLPQSTPTAAAAPVSEWSPQSTNCQRTIYPDGLSVKECLPSGMAINAPRYPIPPDVTIVYLPPENVPLPK